MRYVIVDDEPLARERIQLLMQEHHQFEYIGEADNGPKAVEVIERLRPDLIFLDIEIPGINGFEVLAQITSIPLPITIFVTAFDQYAIKAFEVEAQDYLVKPVSRDRLTKALARIKNIKKHTFDQKPQLIKKLSRQLSKPLTRIPVREGTRIKLIPFIEILWLEFEDAIVFVQTGSQKYYTAFNSLKELEQRLDEQEFFRINRNCLVNLTQISEIIPFGYSQLKIKMRDSTEKELTVSRNQAKELKKVLGIKNNQEISG